MQNQTEIHRRMIELEMQLAHVQRTCDQLNEVVTEQAVRQDRLQHALISLREKLKDLTADSDRVEVDLLQEKPPHY